MVEHGADEGRELGVLFSVTSLWINGCWVFATGVGQFTGLGVLLILRVSTAESPKNH